MKLLFSIISFLLVQNLFGQYKIDPKVQGEFDSVYNALPKSTQKQRYFFPETDSGFTILPYYKTDTLNPKDFLDFYSNFELYGVDPVTKERIPDEPKDTSKSGPCLFASAGYSKDTLYIYSGLFGFGGLGLILRINNQKNVGEYLEAGEPVYRYTIKGKKAPFMLLKGRVENVVLNKMPKKIGEMFYGKATFISAAFYQEDTDFKKGYIHKKYTIRFNFCCKLSNPGKRPKAVADSKEIFKMLKQ